MKPLAGQLAAIAPEFAGQLAYAGKAPSTVARVSAGPDQSGSLSIGRFEGLVEPESLENLRLWANQQRTGKHVAEAALILNSPGGLVEMVPETADVLARLACTKPLHILAEGCCCSAAFWLAAAGTTFTASRSCYLGSVGVMQLLVDDSRLHSMMGVCVIPVATAPGKADGYPGVEVDEEQITRTKVRIMRTLGEFGRDLERFGRGTSEQRARWMASADVMLANDALVAGMIDRVASVDDVLDEKFQSVVASSFAHLTGLEACEKLDELIAKRAKVDEAWEADERHHEAIEKKYPSLAAAAEKHRSRKYRI